MLTDSGGSDLSLPRILIAGLRGSGGKTLVSVGLAAVLRDRGRAVVPFKKGADYIDAAWLAAAAGRPCRNLDLFMLSEDTVTRSFVRAAAAGELSVIEGNRGVYDGMDARGTYSTAALGKLLDAPVILVCDCTKTTRTLAAMVLGCMHFDRDLKIRGVILNRVAGRRHEKGLRAAVESSCGLPVLGAIPKLKVDPFPERHLGLVPPQETAEVPAAVTAAGRVAEQHIDIDAIEKIAREAAPRSKGPVEDASEEPSAASSVTPAGEAKAAPRARIGVFRDEAFQFYYPENLEALERGGAALIECSPLKDGSLPDLDAIYIGGGFPEVYAERLSKNAAFRGAVADAVEAGTPVYAECAGAVYLGKSLVMGDSTYPMTGALPVVYGFGPKPQWHGYAVVEVAGENPYFDVGDSFRGHEFHYSRVLETDESKLYFAFRVGRGYGVDGKRDGICRKNVLATYCHLHALGATAWARALVRAGETHRQKARSR
jgi:cobyrinic acid a,c-diamide synthase